MISLNKEANNNAQKSRNYFVPMKNNMN